ncbi:immunoglobulin domain-containing protein [Paenibacillus silviterrae]|uniref:immunoglobulin domain-containing protein n=1 Tax=Paenibacillus silviterrae TaxID=3242194 RepID=UPI002542A017|nr:immunoglobulin domain-containing protein [Paenibacillus chinjuensis]
MLEISVYAAETWSQFGRLGSVSSSNPGGFTSPKGVAVDSSGNVYVADTTNHRIQKLTISTNTWSEWKKAGGGAGNGLGEFNYPNAVAVDSGGNVYVADSSNHRIQKLDISTNTWSEWKKVGGGNGLGLGEFNNPRGVAVDSSGNVYVADSSNHRIQKLTLSTNTWSEWKKPSAGAVAGSGLGEFNSPYGVAVDSSGNVYVADSSNHRIQKLTLSTNTWSEWKKSGGGTGTSVGEFNNPRGVTVDSSGNVYVADANNHRIQKLALSTNTWSEWKKVDGGSGYGLGEFNSPNGVAVDSGGNVYVADEFHRIQKLTVVSNTWIQWGVIGPTFGFSTGEFNFPRGVAVDSGGNVYVADTSNHRIQKLTLSTNTWSEWKKVGGGTGLGLGEFSSPYGVAVDSSGNVYVADSGNNRIQKLDISTNTWSEWKRSSGGAGSGLGEFNYPSGVAVDSSGNVYVSEVINHRIQKLTISTNTWNEWKKAGGGAGSGLGEFSNPFGVAVDSSGNVYVADTSNHRIQKLNLSTDTWSEWKKIGGGAGNGLGAFNGPNGVTVDSSGNVYVADSSNHRIQKLTLSTNTWNEWKKIGGGAGTSLGELNSPYGVAVDSGRNVYVTDTFNHRIQKLEIPASPITDFASTAKTSTTATFNWTAASGATGIIIEQSPAGANTWTTATTGAIATSSTAATVTGLSAATAYDFRLVVTGGANAGNSNTVSVTTDYAPTYTIAEIADQTATALTAGYSSGTQDTKTITITKTGTGDLTNVATALSGTNATDFVITQPGATTLNSGTTSTTFTVKAKDGLAAGTYTATVTVYADNMTNVTFTVTQTVNPAPMAPSITSQPGNKTVTAGQNATFSVTANGDTPLSYQWKKDSNVLTDSGNISGATTATLSITNAQLSDAGSYTAVVTNAAGNTESNAATLTVNPAPMAPSITSQPNAATVTAGQTATFSVTANGDTPLSYQWKKDGNALTDGGNISGATTATLSITNAQSSDAGSYTAVVTNAAGNTESNAATLTVNPAPVAPSITSQPNAATVTAGQTATFSVTANGDTPLSYQWKKDGNALTDGGNISGATTATLSITNAQSSDAGSYTAVVTNAAGNTESNAATLTVNPAPVAPSITGQPNAATVTAGQTATFSVTANGDTPLSYQWKKDGNALTDGGNISGATTATLSITNAQSGDAGSYTVVVTNAAGNAESNAATLTVNALTNAATPSIGTQPADRTVNVGGSAPLSVTATVSDGGTMSYQWYSNTINSNSGGTLISGATTASYNVPTTMAGTTYYYVVVTNTNNSVNGTKSATNTSSAAKVTVNGAPTYTIFAIPNQTASSLIEGYASGTQETKTINVTNTGTGNLTNLAAALSGNHANDFVVTQPGVTTLDSGITSTTFTVKVKDGLPAGTYTATVTVTADHMSAVTFTATQVVNLPNAPANPQNLVAVGGDRQVTLNWSTVTGATYYNLYMSTTSGQFSNASVTTVGYSTYNVQSLTNGTTYYFIVKAGNLGGLSAESNQVSATPVTVPAAPTNVTAVAGNGQATISFTAPTDNGGSAVMEYEVTILPGNTVIAGTVDPITITGLTNGTSYTFTVKAVNGVGRSVSSAPSNAIIPAAPSSGDNESGNTTTELEAPARPETGNTGVDVLVNGKVESAATATTSKQNEKTVITITVDQKKLDDKLALEGQHSVVAIPVNMKSDVVVGELNGQMIKNMENRQAVLDIKTDRATYTLPAHQINIDAVANQFDRSAVLQDIKVQIEIATPTANTLKIMENAVAKGTFTLVAPSIDFTVKASYEGTTVNVTKFNVYVERTIAIPDGVDPNKITTGVVVEPDGTFRHVPTKVVVIDGKYHAKISSLTNSTYSVVWYPLEFMDMTNHWAKAAVNDMGSRMVIDGTGNGMFNPDRDMTRAELAAIIVRGLGLKLENGTSPFSDIKTTDWHSSAINTAYAHHLIDGFEDGTFRPNDNITREQAMVMIAKAMTITGLKAKLPIQPAGQILQPYTDAMDASAWALSSIADSVQAGIVSGSNGDELTPKALITRAEVAAIVQRLLQKSELI